MNRGFNICNLAFHYGDRPVIDGINLELAAGRFYGIVGPNGCGKSTFLDLLVRNQRPATGAVHYNGRALGAYSRPDLSREIALVPQNFYINFPFTAKEIVMMGRYPHIPRFSAPAAEDESRVAEIMHATQTDIFAHRLITELSGGERQRVVFARALVQETPVLILDEATSNLDVNHAISLLNIAAAGIPAVKAGAVPETIIAVLQDINLAALFCDYLIFMKQGRIHAHGPTPTVLTGDILKNVFNIDAKVYFEPYTNVNQVVFKR